MKPKQKLLGTTLQIRKLLPHPLLILTHCVAAAAGPIKSDPKCTSFVIVDRVPIVAFFLVPPRRWSVMMSSPHQMMESKRRHVIHDRLVRLEHQPHDPRNCSDVVGERHPGPFLRDLLRRKLRVPGKPAEGVPVCL